MRKEEAAHGSDPAQEPNNAACCGGALHGCAAGCLTGSAACSAIDNATSKTIDGETGRTIGNTTSKAVGDAVGDDARYCIRFDRQRAHCGGARQRILLLDMDNTLYSKETRIGEAMAERIRLFFEVHLGVPAEEAAAMGRRFYLDYGLAVKGLIAHFEGVDTRTYDAFVDGGLPLEGLLARDDRLVAILAAFRGPIWIFTNAGRAHALRTLALLGLLGAIDGIIHCDYAEAAFPAKPDRAAYERAAACIAATPPPPCVCAGACRRAPSECLFVDDSPANVLAAAALGWTCLLLDEHGEYDEHLPAMAAARIARIRSIYEMEGHLCEHINRDDE